jgi:hypothetical protein
MHTGGNQAFRLISLLAFLGFIDLEGAGIVSWHSKERRY